MIELFRQYGWAAMLGAALIVVVTHAGLVKLVAALEQKDAATGGAANRGNEPGRK